MLAKLLVILSVWFLLSLIVTLLVGMAISTFREVPMPGFTPALETDWEAAGVEEVEEEQSLVLAYH